MIVLGLTGSIGMGKSTAADMLRGMGVLVHDSDAAVHAAIGPGGCAVDAVSAAFPGVRDNNAIDRKALGRIVFGDDAARTRLESIVHPVVRSMQQDFLNKSREDGAPVVVLDIPLLYETGAEKRVDKVIVVSCPAFIQRRRVLARKDMTAERFERVLSTQTPDAEKRRRADFVVQTGLGRAWTRCALKNIVRKVTKDA